MIRIGYIHECDDDDDMVLDAYSLKTMCDGIDMALSKSTANKAMNVFTEDSVILENKITDGIEKLGEFIENTISKIIAFVQNCVRKIQEVFWSRKTDMQKVEAICRKRPDLAQKIKISFSRGELDVKDIKSLQDVMDGTYDLLGKLDAGKIEPSKAESAFDDIIRKYEKYGKPLIDFASTAMSIALTIKAFGPKINQLKIDAKINKNNLRRMKLSNKLHKDEVNARAYTAHGRIVSKLEKLIVKHGSGIVKIAKTFGDAIDQFMESAGLKQSRADMQKEYDALTKQSEYYNSINNRKVDTKKASNGTK